MNRVPSGDQLAPKALLDLPVTRVSPDPSGSIDARKVGLSNDPRLKMMRPLSPGNVALAASGVNATMKRAISAAAQVLSLEFIWFASHADGMISFEPSSADNKALWRVIGRWSLCRIGCLLFFRWHQGSREVSATQGRTTMNQRARALVAVTAATFLIGAIGVGGGRSARADIAPNGRIAFSSWDEDLNYDIYTVDPANPTASPVKLTTDGRFNGNPDWSPDGSKIVYDGWSTFSGPRIQVMDTDPDTNDSVVLTRPCSGDLDCYGDFQPAWSPDGTRIAFISSRPNADGSENWSYEIYVMDATGEAGPLPQATRLTTDPFPSPSRESTTRRSLGRLTEGEWRFCPKVAASSPTRAICGSWIRGTSTPTDSVTT